MPGYGQLCLNRYEEECIMICKNCGAEMPDETLGSGTKVADAAAQIGLSPYYFSKLFNEYTQMTFPAYLAGIRVQNAINLLANVRYSITDCAFMSGFQSTTTFNKIFREATGCTPREYRKLHKQGR